MRTIDADALMEAINTWPKFGVNEYGRIVPWDEEYEPYIHLRDAVIAITGIPTIEPQRMRVKATLINPNPYGLCSECGYLIDVRDGFNFCPNCGADIK